MKKTVLLVDDDEGIRNKLDAILKRNYLETVHAACGIDAIKVLKQETIDVVLLDIKLPDMNGLEVLAICKEISPTTEVIVISGYGSQEIAIQALRKGAIDYIEKPIQMDILNAALGRSLEKIRATESSYKDTILVIDDEPGAVKRLLKSLSKEGYTVMGAANGLEGLEIIRNHKIDVVITDVRMPEVDGFTVLQEARKLYSDIEVIIITGHGEQELAVQSLRAGAIDYLQKPINLDELMCSVAKAIERISLNRTRLYRDRELTLSTEIISKMNQELENRITERTQKLSETQSQLFHTSKLATLGEMSAGLAHEMNQPLAGIALTTESIKRMILKKSLTDAYMQDAMIDIESSINRMSKIIQHIRIFARQESLKFTKVDVREPIDGAMSLLGAQLRLHEVEVTLELADNLPPITGEPYQLEQVIINIISNARDAMDIKAEGDIEGYNRVMSIKTSETDDFVCIHISDNGLGMNALQKEKIFQPFFTTKAVGKATGLGMSISFGIIESHQGRIEIESEVGEGSLIKVMLPKHMTEREESNYDKDTNN